MCPLPTTCCATLVLLVCVHYGNSCATKNSDVVCFNFESNLLLGKKNCHYLQPNITDIFAVEECRLYNHSKATYVHAHMY